MDSQPITRIRDLQISVAATGVATPVASVDPVTFRDGTVTRAFLPDAEFVRDHDLHVGDAVRLENVGSSVAVAEVLPLLRTGGETPIHMPQGCPECGCDLRQRGRDLVCANAACRPQLAARVAQLAAGAAFDIPALNAQTIHQLVVHRLITTPSDVFKLNERALVKAGFSPAQTAEILASIAHAKHVTLDRLLVAMTAIPPEAASSLAQHARSLARVKRLVAGSIVRLPGVTLDAAEAVLNFVREPRNRRTLAQMARAGVITARVPAARNA